MNTRIKINGKYKIYDLIRHRSASQFKLRDEVIVTHPETGSLCLARVVERGEKYILIRELSDSIAPYQWKIYNSSLFYSVSVINKS